jgi:murein L,D-transpeptidase YafK
MSMKTSFRLACVASLGVLLGGCPLGFGGGGSIAPAMKQLPAETQVQLAKAGMTQEAPIFVRIFKEEAELEIWKEKPDGRYYLFKSYPICTFSGELGPKIQEGDKQSPEGFYTVSPGQMNPNSQFHLAFNLGYPNDYDKANGRTGAALMVHGDCRSAGCYAMTDALIEEIYALAREAFGGGQTKFHVHAFPFRMTQANMERHKKSKWASFWKTLKVGYDDFELSRVPPKVAVCQRQYLVNADFFGQSAKPDPSGACPAYRRVPVERFNPVDGQLMVKNTNAPQPANRLASYAPTAAGPRSEAPNPAIAEEGRQQPPVQGSASPVQTAPAAPDNSGLAFGSTTASPQSSSYLASPQTPTMAVSIASETEEEKAERERRAQSETPGLHNVAKSGKGDMVPAPAPR